MDEDIHNEDDYFKQAYQNSREEPSPEVWKKINARLDKIEATNYSNKRIGWKRIACVLLLIISSAGAYEWFAAKTKSAAKAGFIKNNKQANKAAVQQPSVTHKSIAQEEDKNKSSNTIHSFYNDKLYSKNKSEVYSSRNYHQHSNSQMAATNGNQKEAPDENTTVNNGQPILQQKQTDLNQSTQLNSSFNNNALHQPDKAVEIWGKNKEVITDTTSALSIANNTLRATHDSITTAQAAKTMVAHTFKKYWTIMPFVSVDFTQYTLDDDATGNNNTTEDKQDIEQRERHQFSFSAGITAKRQITRKLSVKSGLLYSNIAIGIHPQTLYASTDGNQTIGYKFVTSSGYAYVKPLFGTPIASGDSIQSDVSKHHLQYLNIPLLAGYKIKTGKRLSITPEAGISANVLLSTRVRTELNENLDKETVVIKKLQGVRNVYYSFIADAEMQYRINQHISIVGLPVFKYAINSINKNNVVKTYPYSISVAAGINYRF